MNSIIEFVEPARQSPSPVPLAQRVWQGVAEILSRSPVADRFTQHKRLERSR